MYAPYITCAARRWVFLQRGEIVGVDWHCSFFFFWLIWVQAGDDDVQLGSEIAVKQQVFLRLLTVTSDAIAFPIEGCHRVIPLCWVTLAPPP